MPGSAFSVAPLVVSGVSHVFDNIPQAGLILWLDAYKLPSVASGTAISVWTDSSASKSNATQNSAVSQPTYMTNIKNGLPAIFFSSASAQVLVSNTSLIQPCTVAVTASLTTTAGNAEMIGGFSLGNNALLALAAGYAGFAGTVLSSSSFTVNAWITSIGMFSGSSTTHSLSGKTVFGNAGVGNDNQTSVGGRSATNFSNGLIGEALVYNRILSESERASLETYLRTKWGTL